MEKKENLVKKLISEGNISLETISKKMKIPITSLVLMKRKIDKENQNKKIIQTENGSRYKKIYDKYVSMYYGRSMKKSENKLDIKENESVTIAINEISNIVDSEDIELDRKVFSVIPIIKKIKDEEFSLSQADSLITLFFNRTKLPFPEHYKYADFRQVDITYKKLLVKKFTRTLKYECEQTDSIDRLKELKKYLTPQIMAIEPMSTRIINENIISKISRIEKNSIMNNFEKNISNNICNIACCIASETINMDFIEDSMRKELDERMSVQNVKGVFSLTLEQHRKQIFYKVSKALENYADIYPIYDADNAIIALEKIFSMGINSNFKCVIQNFIERKEYNEAKAICDNYSKKTETFSTMAKAIDRARTEIAKAELGDIILKGLEARVSNEEHEEFINSVDRKIACLGYMKSSIPLGRSEDKTKKIMLSDIWVDKEINKGR